MSVRVEEHICTACAAGKYKDTIGSSSCTPCPSNSFSATARTSITSCTCNSGYEKVGTDPFICNALHCGTGYTGPPGSCTLCIAGTYKAESGSAACDQCVAGKFSVATGQSSSGTCQNCSVGTYASLPGSFACTLCLAFSTSPAGSSVVTQCTCNAGSTGADGGQCTQCVAGTYKAQSGSAACDACVAGKFSAGTGQISGTTCQNCAVGKFSAAAASVCTNCAAGSYAAIPGSLECTKCPSNSSSPGASIALTACQCDTGFSGPNGGTCTACVAGSYKTTVGSVSCTLCAVNTYGTAVAAISITSCVACPGNTTSVTGSSQNTSCQCKAGYSGPDGGRCDPCSAGSYKNTIGSATCSACPENAVSAVASTAVASCKCDSGHSGLDGGLCTACSAGSYKPTTGSVACVLCGVNAYGTILAAISNASCVACPGNSTSVRGSDKPELCFCKAGYEQTTSFDACIECRPGFYDNITNRHECSRCGGGLYSAFWGATGMETCKECGPGTWSEIGSATCQSCPPNSNSSVRSAFLSDCKCIAGATGEDGQTCELCEAGEYKASSGNASCLACSENSFSLRGSSRCLCNVGYTGPDSGNCIECEAGKYKNASGSSACQSCFLNAISLPASTDKSSCVCKAGYNGTSEGNCTACASGKYKAAGNGDCQGCPEFSAPGLSFASCQCNTGYRIVNKACKACEIGTFKNIFGNTSLATEECQLVEKFSPATGITKESCCKCRENSTTLAVGTVRSVDCLCLPGFGGSWCVACTIGKYKANVSMDECVSCPLGATTLGKNSSSVSDCVAAEGYYGNTTFGFLPCSNGSYAPSIGMQQCLLCPAGATSDVGASTAEQCVCELPGWRRSVENGTELCSCQARFARDTETMLCQLCRANYSCAGGDLPAQPCPNASLSVAGSAAQTNCVCTAGHTGPDGGPCRACTKGEWKGENGSSACIKCAPNASSAIGSTSAEACLCQPGFTGPDGGLCSACQIGTYKEKAGSLACSNCSTNTTTRERGSDEYVDCLCERGLEFAGFSPVTNTTICAACPVGKYKEAPGHPQVCVSCPANSTTVALGASVRSDCVCVSGRYSVVSALNVSSCQHCTANTFKVSAGNAACTPCPANASAPAGSNASTACQCFLGFTGPNGGACAPCLPGQYKAVIGSSACVTCLSNSMSPAASRNVTACACNAGFIGPPGGPCSSCQRDTYAYNGMCVLCPKNSESEPASGSVTSCKCLSGYSGPGGGPCSECGVGLYRRSADAQCIKCPKNTNTTSAVAQSATACTGIAGFVRGVVKAPSVKLTIICPYSLDEFTDDVQTSFKRGISAAARVDCDCDVSEAHVFILDVVPFSEGAAARRLLQASVEMTYGIEVPSEGDGEELLNLMSLSNINSALQAQGVNGSTHNTSKVLMREDIVYAAPCPQNTYKKALGNSSCTSCPPQSTAPSSSTSIDACKCIANLKKNGDGSCDRDCAAGFETRTGNDGETACAACRPSYYKTVAGDQDCTRCPPYSFSLLTNQTSITSCMCAQGYTWNAATKLCDACPPGTFNNKYNESVCYLCNTTCPT